MRFVSLLMLGLVVGCDGGEKADEVDDGAALAALEAGFDAYTSWNQPVPGIEEATSVHTDYVQVWTNDVAWDTIQAAAGGDMPVGAMLFKDSYADADGTTLNNVTSMYKMEDGWYYARFSADGEVTLDGFEPAACHDCHTTFEGAQDGVFIADW